MQTFFMRTKETLLGLRGCAGWLNNRQAPMPDGSFSDIVAHFNHKQLQRYMIINSIARNKNGYPQNIFLSSPWKQMNQRMTKPTKWHVHPAKTQISLGTQWVANDPSFLLADSESIDRIGRMPMLIWVFARRTCNFDTGSYFVGTH